VNPSAREFLAADLAELPEGERRFLHWPPDGVLTESRTDEALRKCERYFLDGKAYAGWFRHYSPCFQELGISFEAGTACHTDYASPFATHKSPTRVQARLRTFGIQFWRKVIEALPKVEVIFGHGAGWRVVPEHLGFTFDDWEDLFADDSDVDAAVPRQFPNMAYRIVEGRRRLLVLWWKPNCFGRPLDPLSDFNKAKVGRAFMSLAEKNGFLR
jgi:hypothetical protein